MWPWWERAKYLAQVRWCVLWPYLIPSGLLAWYIFLSVSQYFILFLFFNQFKTLEAQGTLYPATSCSQALARGESAKMNVMCFISDDLR